MNACDCRTSLWCLLRPEGYMSFFAPFHPLFRETFHIHRRVLLSPLFFSSWTYVAASFSPENFVLCAFGEFFRYKFTLESLTRFVGCLSRPSRPKLGLRCCCCPSRGGFLTVRAAIDSSHVPRHSRRKSSLPLQLIESARKDLVVSRDFGKLQQDRVCW